LTAYHTREALIVEASFLRNDLPYFAELLAEVITQTKYTSETRLHSQHYPHLTCFHLQPMSFTKMSSGLCI
jgi:hypothetical protein